MVTSLELEYYKSGFANPYIRKTEIVTKGFNKQNQENEYLKYYF